MTDSLWSWLGFNLFVLALLALDLGVLHRRVREITFREALAWSAFWIVLALAWAAGVWHLRGASDALGFLTGYLIEKSLSVDNLFVILLIFSYFGIPVIYQHRVLFWGILGALFFRALFILAGVALIERFHFMIYVFGAFLILTGIRMALGKEKRMEPDKNPVLKAFRRLVPVTSGLEDGRFFTRRDGRLWATPLLVALLLVELSDVVFAVDSIPAILAVTREPFLVYTANVFAILGLRSLYFALAGIMRMFGYLHYGLAVILVVVGVKMLLVDTPYAIPTGVSLAVTVLTLALSILASLLWPRREEALPGAAALSGGPAEAV